jgi:hypothetical protein
VVERTYGWPMLHRRLARDYETLPARSEAVIHPAMTDLMARRLTGEDTVWVALWFKPNRAPDCDRSIAAATTWWAATFRSPAQTATPRRKATKRGRQWKDPSRGTSRCPPRQQPVYPRVAKAGCSPRCNVRIRERQRCAESPVHYLRSRLGWHCPHRSARRACSLACASPATRSGQPPVIRCGLAAGTDAGCARRDGLPTARPPVPHRGRGRPCATGREDVPPSVSTCSAFAGSTSTPVIRCWTAADSAGPSASLSAGVDHRRPTYRPQKQARIQHVAVQATRPKMHAFTSSMLGPTGVGNCQLVLLQATQNRRAICYLIEQEQFPRPAVRAQTDHRQWP